MKKEELLQTIRLAKENSKKRKFVQSVDLIVNLKDIDLKKEKVQNYINLPFAVKKAKIAAFVDAELKKEADSCCDLVITKEDFDKYKDKKLKKKLANGADFFVSQANLMALVATDFGKVLGPKGRMPDPKIGAVIPPGGSIKSVVDRLKTTVRVEAKGGNMVKALVGKEDMNEDNVVANILSIYENLVNVLPNHKENIKNIIVKLSMGRPVKVGENDDDIKNRLKSREESRLKLKELRRKEAEKVRKRVKKIDVVKEEKKEEKRKESKEEVKEEVKEDE